MKFVDMQKVPTMYSFDEIGLMARAESTVDSRSKVNPFTREGKLPIFVSPMTCIINKTNYGLFEQNGFTPIMPVEYGNWDTREDMIVSGRWVALTKKEFKMWFLDVNRPDDYPHKILIDTAQGHMKDLYDMVKEAKSKWSGLVVMIGNLENPQAYINCCRAGVDYVRISVGTGSGCLTSLVTGFHASIPFILNEIQRIKYSHIVTNWSTGKIEYYETNVHDAAPFNNESEEECDGEELKCLTKIVADGGIVTPDRMCKALALGADYVMMGSAFSHTEIACGATRPIEHRVYGLERLYYGQASERGQLDRFNEVRNTPEGTERWIPVNTTIKDLRDTYEGSLRSAMSYNGSFDLGDFIGGVEFNHQTEEEYKLYYKK